MRLASAPTASGRPSLTFTATTEGSFKMMPRPRTYTRVFAVPRSTALCRPRKKNRLSRMSVDLPLDGAGTVAESGRPPASVLGVGPRLRDLAQPHKARSGAVAGRNRRPRPRAASAETREEDVDLSRRRLGGVRAVDEVLGEKCPQIPPHGPRGRLGGIGRPHQHAHDAPRVLGALHDEDHRGRTRDEAGQLAVEGLVTVLFVVPGRCLLVDP